MENIEKSMQDMLRQAPPEAAGPVSGNHAELFQATSGDMSGQVFLLINDGTPGYQTGDLIVRMNNTAGTLTDSNFKVG